MNDNLDFELEEQLDRTLQLLIAAKPDDRSNKDRLFAVLKTDLEKLIAFYHYYILSSYHIKDSG